jgi:uncharacterized protein DUF6526
MSETAPQTYATHRRFVPAFHFLTFGILVINLVWRVWQAFRFFSFESALGVALAVALVLLAWYTRTFALTVQDRVIRLEERLRLERLLPADLRDRCAGLTRSQLIALRFASDEELPELVRAILAGTITGREEIKKSVRNWRADDLRA